MVDILFSLMVAAVLSTCVTGQEENGCCVPNGGFPSPAPSSGLTPSPTSALTPSPTSDLSPVKTHHRKLTNMFVTQDFTEQDTTCKECDAYSWAPNAICEMASYNEWQTKRQVCRCNAQPQMDIHRDCFHNGCKNTWTEWSGKCLPKVEEPTKDRHCEGAWKWESCSSEDKCGTKGTQAGTFSVVTPKFGNGLACSATDGMSTVRDCSSKPCATGTCFDGILSGDEFGVDCGGSCDRCDVTTASVVGLGCTHDQACSGFCDVTTSNVCQPMAVVGAQCESNNQCESGACGSSSICTDVLSTTLPKAEGSGVPLALIVGGVAGALAICLIAFFVALSRNAGFSFKRFGRRSSWNNHSTLGQLDADQDAHEELAAQNDFYPGPIVNN